jgi:hypothetical protein
MEENRDPPLDPGSPQSQSQFQSQPRRFVYRSVDPDPQPAHPMRRSTDTPQAFQGIPGQLCPNPLLLKFRVYLKLN